MEIFEGITLVFHTDANIDLASLNPDGWRRGEEVPSDVPVAVIYDNKCYVTRFDTTPGGGVLNDNSRKLWLQVYDFEHNLWKIL